MTKKRTSLQVAASFLVVCFLLAGCDNEKRPGEAPFLSLKTYAGETFVLSPKDTAVTLVVFWATWCRPCLMEIPTLMALQEKYRARDFRVVGVNIDDPVGDRARPILERFGVNYTVVIGNDEVARKFGGFSGIPTSFLIGRDGLLKDKVEGMAPSELLDGKILPLL